MPEETNTTRTPGINVTEYNANIALAASAGTFGDALLALKAGKKVARKGWEETKSVQLAQDRSYEFESLILLFENGGNQSNYGNSLSLKNLLAEDWFVVE